MQLRSGARCSRRARAGADGADCLTAAQAAAIAKVYSGPVSNGKPFFPGYMPGSEAVTTGCSAAATGSGWMNVIVGAQPDAKPADFNLAEDTMRYLVHTPPKAGLRLQDIQLRPRHSSSRRLEQAGGREESRSLEVQEARRQAAHDVRMGGLDPAADGGRELLRAGVAKNGPDTQDFFRLFMVPGMSHCGGGIGPDRHDPVTAMINWVEKGKAPASMVASRVVNNQVVRTRPLCPYPQVARYTGQGSIDDAANFRCVAP